MSNTIICQTPLREVRRIPDKVRWCFKCRIHAVHDWIVLDAIEQPSWYDPIGRFDCPSCHEEHVLFPGREWEEQSW